MNAAQVLLTFPSIHGVIAAEQALLTAGIPVGIMPLPGKLGRGCGMGLRVEASLAAQALGLCPETAPYAQDDSGAFVPWAPPPR